jgi:hypothetical protein
VKLRTYRELILIIACVLWLKFLDARMMMMELRRERDESLSESVLFCLGPRELYSYNCM